MPTAFFTYKNDKLQRIGLLKILVATLDPQRRSVASDLINRKLSDLLYEGGLSQLSRVESLIRAGDSSSWLFTLPKTQVGQILEWGKLYEFVGAGNQITEKGLLLRQLMGMEAVQSIVRGDFSVNPFRLSPEERFYFLYRNFEMDPVLFFLIKRLRLETGELPIGGVHAGKITCFALYDSYKLFSGVVGTGNLLPLRDLRDLIGRIVAELGLSSDIPIQPILRPRPPVTVRQKPDQRNRKRTKTADHEAIPRFELLTDLGFLTKNTGEEGVPDIEKSRKSWRYWITPLLAEYSLGLPENYSANFCWSRFAQTATALLGGNFKRLSIESEPALIARRCYEGYLDVKRVFGHTPLESIANIAMIRSLARSEVFEMREVHQLFLSFKRENLFPDTVRFAAGNDLDQMFIDIKPSFIAEMEEHYGKGAP